MACIVFDLVSKYLGSRKVLHALSFRVQRGEIVGLLGPNGSGKTTTLRLTAGYYRPDEGEVRVQGMANATGRPGVYAGYLPEKAPLYDSLTVIQYLQFVAECKGLKGKLARSSVDDAISAFDLGRVARTAIGRLSKGFRQRVGLAQSILGDPAVLLLDEATNGLDPMQILEAREMIRKAAEGRAVIFSSHLMQEVHALCSRALILRYGRLIADVPLKAAGEGADGVILLHWRGISPESLSGALLTLEGVSGVEIQTDDRRGHCVVRVQCTVGPDSMNPFLHCAMQHGEVLSAVYEAQDVESLLVAAVRESDRQAGLLAASA